MAPPKSSNRRPVWKLNTLDKALFSFPGYNNEHDDDTVITSNLLRRYGTQRERQQQLEQEYQMRNAVDRRRAPRIAALLFFTFFLFAGSSFIVQNVRGGATSTVMSKSQNGDKNEDEIEDEIESNQRTAKKAFKPLTQKVEEALKPNLDSNRNPIRLPPELANLADVNIPLKKEHEVAIFWHIPRSGGSTVKEIASFCYDLTLASEVGTTVDPEAATLDKLVTVVDKNTGAKFLNVDTTSPDGLERAKKFSVATSKDLDLITTPYIFTASDALFNAVNRGRLIVFFRHPVERAVSMYYYLKDKAGIRGAQIGESLDLYAKSNLVENNWMTRFLTNKMGGELTPDDEAMAREVLRSKALIGLLSKKTESLERFKTYFGWNNNDAKKHLGDCEDKLLHWGWKGKNRHKGIEEGSDTWNYLEEQNRFDIRLYEYAVELFEVQSITLFSIV